MARRINRTYFRYQIMNRIGLFVLTGILLAGCAATPYPSVEVYMEPIAEHFNVQIDPETGAATVVKKGVAVTIEPLDEVELFALTDDPRVNPYLIVEKNGAVQPIFTMFEITVHNRENRRVLFEDRAVLIDGRDTQYANLSSDFFDSLYDNVDQPHNDPWAMSYPYAPVTYHSYHGYYQSYLDAEALEWGRMVIEDDIFESGKLFSGAKRSGFLIFDRLPSDTTDIRIVVPGVRIIHENDKEDKLEFKIDFRQILQPNIE